MDVSSIASLATDVSQAKTSDAVQLAVMKKAMNLEAQGAAQLVQAAVQTMATYNNPPNLGNKVDVFA